MSEQETPKASSTATPGTAARIPGLPEHWQNFLLSITFQILIPVLPILLELGQKHTVGEQSITLAASMFAIGVGTSSRNVLLMGLTVVVSILSAIAYGDTLHTNPSNELTTSGWSAAVSMIAISLIYIAERYNRHVADREIFLEFMRRGAQS
jgi:hypothetical protein